MYGAKMYGAKMYGAKMFGAKMFGAKMFGENIFGEEMFGVFLANQITKKNSVNTKYNTKCKLQIPGSDGNGTRKCQATT